MQASPCTRLFTWTSSVTCLGPLRDRVLPVTDTRRDLTGRTRTCERYIKWNELCRTTMWPITQVSVLMPCLSGRSTLSSPYFYSSYSSESPVKEGKDEIVFITLEGLARYLSRVTMKAIWRRWKNHSDQGGLMVFILYCLIVRGTLNEKFASKKDLEFTRALLFDILHYCVVLVQLIARRYIRVSCGYKNVDCVHNFFTCVKNTYCLKNV